MSRRNKKDDDLDMQTSFADMNVEGFKWYDPSKKKEGNERKVKHSISRREYWQMVKSAFLAFMPYLLMFILGMSIVVVLLYIWLTA